MINHDTALEVLNNNAQQIYQLIQSQKNHLCLAKCPAFEEVVDTQLFGLSKQVEFAVSIQLIEEFEGYQIMSDLEHALNMVYTEVYEQMK